MSDCANETTTPSEVKDARRVLDIVGARLFYDKYDIIHALPAPTRVKNALSNADLKSLAKIERESDASLMRLPMFGKKSLKELRKALSEIKKELGINGFSDELIQETQKKIKQFVEVFGEDRGREILYETWEKICEQNRLELQKNLKDIIENITPEKTPFAVSGSVTENNLHEWNTKKLMTMGSVHNENNT